MIRSVHRNTVLGFLNPQIVEEGLWIRQQNFFNQLNCYLPSDHKTTYVFKKIFCDLLLLVLYENRFYSEKEKRTLRFA